MVGRGAYSVVSDVQKVFDFDSGSNSGSEYFTVSDDMNSSLDTVGETDIMSDSHSESEDFQADIDFSRFSDHTPVVPLSKTLNIRSNSNSVDITTSLLFAIFQFSREAC